MAPTAFRPEGHAPLLLPTPRRHALTGGCVALPRSGPLRISGASPQLLRTTLELRLPDPPGESSGRGRPWKASNAPSFVAATLDRQPGAADGSYTIRIAAPDGAEPPVRLIAHDDAGLRGALLTLAQLVRQYPHALPAMVVSDAPAFPTRGVMLDISRDKVPTMASLFATVDLLASLKFNHLQLYTEHTFAYAGHEEVWRDASPITPDEARALDAYCRDRGIDLCPNQNCFGHLRNWLDLPRYAPLAEIAPGQTWTFMHWPRTGPFSLCPVDPRSEDLVRNLLGQLLPCFTSTLVNIGCDETFDVGRGRSAPEITRRGKDGRQEVYFDFVRRIADIARAHGRRPMMWADIALSHPESLHLFPKDAVGLAWGYEPDAPFAAWCDRLREHGVEPWVCPGTSSWRSITGRTAERRANLAAAATQGLGGGGGGATGFLATDWGDNGHHQHWPVTLNALAHAAEAAWNPAAAASFDPRAASLHALDDPSLELAPWLDRLGEVDRPIRAIGGPDGRPIRNASALFLDLYRPPPYTDPVNAPAEAWRTAGEELAATEAGRPAVPDALINDELVHTLATARLAVDHAIATREPAGLSGSARARLAEQARALLAEHRRLWPLRNRPGGLAASCAHFERILARTDPR